MINNRIVTCVLAVVLFGIAALAAEFVDDQVRACGYSCSGGSSDRPADTSDSTLLQIQRPAARSMPKHAASENKTWSVWWQAYGPDIESAAVELVKQMTWDEKVGLTRGTGAGWVGFDPQPVSYTGATAAVPRLGIPSILVADASQGFRTADPGVVGRVTSWPSGLAVAATWDSALTYRYAAGIGGEFRARGANAILGPTLDVGRFMKAGRNGESFGGEDPYLGAELASQYIHGMKAQGVACVGKHFIMYNQETNRMSYNAQTSKRVLWEVLYKPFEASIAAGMASVMCAYNSVGGHQACQNADTLHDLKEVMNFKGWVMSDWWAVTNLGEAGRNGLDQIMPGTMTVWDSNYLKYQVGEDRVNNMTLRVLRGMLMAGAFETATCMESAEGCEPIYYTDTTSGENERLAREVAAASVVMLNNSDGVLPLSHNARIALVGSACNVTQVTDPNSVMWNYGDYYVNGGSGRVLSSRTVSIASGLEARGATFATSLSESVDGAMALLASGGFDVVVACGGVTSGEAQDRGNLQLNQQAFLSQLARRIAEETKLPLVVLTMSSGSVLTPFASDSAAILSTFLAGQATGHAFADVLFGDVNPSARLPVTFPLSDSDGAQICYTSDCAMSEGLEVGWKGLIKQEVAFPFGHGQSFTSFAYQWDMVPYFERAHHFVGMTMKVTNTGDRAGAEVVQLYMQFPPYAGEPARNLRGFKKTQLLAPGASEVVTFVIPSRDLSIWWEREAAVPCCASPEASTCARELAAYRAEGQPHPANGLLTRCHRCSRPRSVQARQLSPSSSSSNSTSQLDDSCGNGWVRVDGSFNLFIGASSRDERLVWTIEVPAA